MTDLLTALLLRQSEGGRPLLSGSQAKSHFAPAFDRLLERCVLVELSPATEWPVCGTCECGMNARSIQNMNGELRALCPLDSACDTALEPDDLRAFRIDPERLVEEIAKESGIFGPVEALASNLWRIGGLASGRSIVVAVSARVLDQPGIVLVLKQAANGARVTVVSPHPRPAARQRFLEAGIDLVELGATLRPGPYGVDRFDHEVLQPKCNGPRLSLDVVAKAVLIDGTPQRVPVQPFNLLVLLARGVREGTGPVGNHAIQKATKREPRDLVRDLRHALSENRPNASELNGWIEARRSFAAFELVLEPQQVEIIG